MEAETFERRVKANRLRSEDVILAARRVLVDGMSINEASRVVGVNVSLVHRTVKKLQSDACPCCGGSI